MAVAAVLLRADALACAASSPPVGQRPIGRASAACDCCPYGVSEGQEGSAFGPPTEESIESGRDEVWVKPNLKRACPSTRHLNGSYVPRLRSPCIESAPPPPERISVPGGSRRFLPLAPAFPDNG